MHSYHCESQDMKQAGWLQSTHLYPRLHLASTGVWVYSTEFVGFQKHKWDNTVPTILTFKNHFVG